MSSAQKGRKPRAESASRRKYIDGHMHGGKMEPPPHGCQKCFSYVEEISNLTKIIQDLKAKVSYYENAASRAPDLPKANPYADFAKVTVPSKNSKPDKSPSYNRYNTTLHVYPTSARPVEKKGNPCDWFAPDVLVAPPDYYGVDNSGPSSDESESESEDDSTAYQPGGESHERSEETYSTSSRSYKERSEGSSSVIDEEDEEIEDDSKQDDESEEQSDVLEDDELDFRNCFPYEENLFALSRDFQIHERIGTGDDAIVYRATERKTGQAVAIKFRDEWNRRGKHPKELRLINTVQGHPITCNLICWHSLPNTKCHAIVTKLCPNTDIEHYVFGNPVKIRKYMHDLMEVIRYLHERNVLYRDVKPDNVLWDEENGRLNLIDFDVATFYDPKRLHRRLVGTDGYMAPEVLSVSSEVEELEKQERYRNRKNRDELLLKLSLKGYGLEADVYSCGVLFGQLLFSYPQEDIMDDDMTERSGEGMALRATKRLAKLAKLKSFTAPADEEESEDGPRRMSKDEYCEFLALDLCVKMLRVNPTKRISVKDSLSHPYFTDTRAFDAIPARTVPYDKRAEALNGE
jgi:serine/threonine protein kinase